MNKQKIIRWVLFFLIFFVLLQIFNKPKSPAPQLTAGDFSVTAAKTEYAIGEEVLVKIRNNTTASIILPSRCPKNPFRVMAWTDEKFEERSAETKLNCSLSPDITAGPGEEKSISLTYWNHSLFGQTGRYKIEVELPAEKGNKQLVSSPEFTVVEAGFFRKFFRTAFYQPLYNILIFFIAVAPARDLGFAIILLTLLIRLILLVPSQRAILSQRRMQELQPKLEHVKKKYAGNQEKIAAETMQLWKEHKVNPLGSCLPILIQFPVLIALFYVIRNGLNPDNTHLLYSPLKDVDLSNLHTNFLGILELTRVNALMLPLIIGGLQFFQMKLAMAKKAGQESAQKSEMESATKMMNYMMPVMIALFTASVPAGVGLYWGISTVFAIGQQLVANKKVSK